MSGRGVIVAFAVAAGVITPQAWAEAKPFRLENPIACELGVNCFIQQYADHDPSPDARDYLCGHAVYDGHDGTDFRLPDKMAQARGVAVLAAADGVVFATRDGEPDFAVGAFDAAKVKGKECGNGVVIRHADGWETQYCHMRQGSLAVKKGQAVTAGTTLGLVGQSGDAAFVHLHLTVRHDGKPVDPFGPTFGSGRVSACDAKSGTSGFLWSDAAAPQMAYRGTQVLNIGFASGAVSADDIERGGIAPPTAKSAALVVYARAIALQAGDVQSLSLTDPDGRTIATTAPVPLDRDKAQYMIFTGKKQTAWQVGTYHAVYTVTRSGRVVLSRDATLNLS